MRHSIRATGQSAPSKKVEQMGWGLRGGTGVQGRKGSQVKWRSEKWKRRTEVTGRLECGTKKLSAVVTLGLF